MKREEKKIFSEWIAWLFPQGIGITQRLQTIQKRKTCIDIPTDRLITHYKGQDEYANNIHQMIGIRQPSELMIDGLLTSHLLGASVIVRVPLPFLKK